MAVIYATMQHDKHGLYFVFGNKNDQHVFRPEASVFSPGPCRAFNKERYAVGVTRFNRWTADPESGEPIDINHMVSPQFANHPDGLPRRKSRYLVVYTKDRRELWCDHGGLTTGTDTQQYHPLKETKVSEKKVLWTRSQNIVKEWSHAR